MTALSARESGHYLTGPSTAPRDHGVQTMKFVYDQPNKRIVSDDPEIWVEDCGRDRDRGRAFVLYVGGKAIGFREPDSREEHAQEKGDGSLTWTVGEIGSFVRGWDDAADGLVEKASSYRFRDREEQGSAIELIRCALSVYTGAFGKNEIPEVHVSFTPALLEKLSSGVLVK